MLDFADVKPSFLNALIIVLMVILLVPLMKFLFIEKVRIPGFSGLLAMV